MIGGGGLTQIRRVFASRNYAIAVTGQMPHWVATWMVNVGVGWLAWELTHSPAWLGLLAAAELAPAIVLAPFAGARADRTNPLQQMRWAQACHVAQAIALALLVLAGNVRIEALAALVLLSGLIHPFSSTARFGVVPSLVAKQDLATAIAVESALFHTSRFLGPALAAFAISLFGVKSVFIANVAGSLAFLIALQLIRLGPGPGRAARGGRLLTDVAEGLRYVRRHPGILPIFGVLLVVSVCARPLQDMMAAFAGSVFHTGATGLAWLVSALGVGSMLSASFVALRASVSATAVLIACGGLGLSMGLFLASDVLLAGVLFAGCIGFALNSISTRVQALVQTAVDDQLRGRVMSLYMVLFRGTPALGALFFGLLAEAVGLRMSFALAALLCLAIALALLPRRHAISAGLSGGSAERETQAI